MKKWIIELCSIAVVLAVLAAVLLDGREELSDSTQPPAQATAAPTVPAYLGEVRIYQCDPQKDDAWKAIAEQYTMQTGVRVTIMTVQSDDCADALAGYMQQTGAPTIFCLHSSADALLWEDHCLDLTGTRIVSHLQNDAFALRDGEAILGVAAEMESYGLIYNAQLLARAGYTASDITDLTALRDIAQDITANRRTLGFSAFVSPDLRSTAHRSMLCLLAGVSNDAAAVRSIVELYAANCAADVADFSQTTAQDALDDFLSGKAVFYPGGTWEYEKFDTIKDYNLGFVPIYTADTTNETGLDHLCTRYWCINSQTSPLDQAASLSFLNWLVTAKEDEAAPADALEQLMPYRMTRYTANALEQLALESLRKGVATVREDPCGALSTALLEQLGDALAAYAASPTQELWDLVAKNQLFLTLS